MSGAQESGTIRDAIFSRIRAAIGESGVEERREAVRERIDKPARNLIPARASGTPEQLIEQFRDMLHRVEATTDRLPFAELAEGVARFLAAQQLPMRVRLGDDPQLANIDWSAAALIELDHGPASKQDAVSLTRAFAAASETGTLFVASGSDNPVTLSFLPPVNIVLVRAGDILGSYEQAFDRLRAERGADGMPRTLNLISGPSRTADIEQTLITGAHGPMKLHVLIAD